MEIVNLRMHNVRKLKPLLLERGVFNNEAYILILNKKYLKGTIKEDKVFKYLDAQDDDKVMAKKTATVMALDSSSYKEIDELVIPDTIVVIGDKITGFGMTLIRNHRNLGIIINDDDERLKTKLRYLKDVGTIIDKVQKQEDEYSLNFGDLNEFNFIVDEDDNVKAVDLDSAYIGSGTPTYTAYYLLKNPYIKQVPEKYQVTRSDLIIPSDNSDLYCYNMILLNAMSGIDMFKIDIPTYYGYTNYLKELGLPADLIRCFNDIYTPAPNINPKDMLDELNGIPEKELKFKTYVKRKKPYME